jgi:hypothetical protein
MHNPLRSEADAFRWVVVIGAGAAIVIAVTLLTRPGVGVALACLMIGAGIGSAWRSSRGGLPRRVGVGGGAGDGRHRILVIANQTVGGHALLDEIRNRTKGRDSEVLVMTPALTTSQLQHWSSDTDEATETARQRMELSVLAVKELGLRASGRVGDSDPNVALEDALQSFPADEVVISTHPPDRSRWLEHGVVERARKEVALPVTHVVVDLQAEGSQSTVPSP